METVLGLLGLLVYIVAVIALAGAVTFGVVRLLPAEGRRRKRERDAAA